MSTFTLNSGLVSIGSGDREGSGGTRRRVGAGEKRAARLARLRLVARVMDSCIELPGTRQRVGLDPIIGLVPVVGDVLTTAVSLYIVYEGCRLGASRTQVASMLGNVALDLAAGAIPVVGDFFDFAFTANQRNLRILGIADEGVRVCLDSREGVCVRRGRDGAASGATA
jgi:hypothetical protein